MNMKKSINDDYLKDVTIAKDALKCSCGKTTVIVHCSNFHDGTGLFYTECDCGKSHNVEWKSKSLPVS